MLGRWRERRHALDEPFPDEWRALLAERMVHWTMLDDEERKLLEDLIRVFLADKRWEAASGCALDATHKVCISAMACLLLLGLNYEYFHKVKWISVHPTTVVLKGIRGTGADGAATDSPS